MNEAFRLRDDTKIIEPFKQKYESTYAIYLEAVKWYPPSKYVVLFAIGDFYETYDDYAETVARLTNATITKYKNCLLCGFPKYALRQYSKQITDGNRELKIFTSDEIEELKK